MGISASGARRMACSSPEFMSFRSFLPISASIPIVGQTRWEIIWRRWKRCGIYRPGWRCPAMARPLVIWPDECKSWPPITQSVWKRPIRLCARQKAIGVSAYQVAARLFAGRFDSFQNRRFAVGEALAHLEYLCFAGRLVRFEDARQRVGYHIALTLRGQGAAPLVRNSGE